MRSPEPVLGATPQEFVDADLSGARFVRSSLAGAVMRAVEIGGADIDAPWLLGGDNALLVNGVDVVPFVEDELIRRFPDRVDRRAEDPDGLRRACTLCCLHTILEKKWEHHRFAVRDLAAIQASGVLTRSGRGCSDSEVRDGAENSGGTSCRPGVRSRASHPLLRGVHALRL